VAIVALCLGKHPIAMLLSVLPVLVCMVAFNDRAGRQQLPDEPRDNAVRRMPHCAGAGAANLPHCMDPIKTLLPNIT
jgi:hypothetical protein